MMTLTLKGEIYTTRHEVSGLMSARLPSTIKTDSEATNLKDAIVVSHGENVSYPYLRKWIGPILQARLFELSSIICHPSDVPTHVRSFFTDNCKTILVTNNFPRMGCAWNFTTKGLSEANRASHYHRDSVSDAANDFICTPLVYHRAGLTSTDRNTVWVADVTHRTLGQTNRPEFSGHVMNIKPISNTHFLIADQYGVAIVHERVVAMMAKARASLFANDPHMFQVVG